MLCRKAKTICINCMHTLYVNKISVHKLFTKNYEVEMLKHKKLNEKWGKRARNPPEPEPWLPGSPQRTSLLLVHSSTARAGRCRFCLVHAQKAERKCKVLLCRSLRWVPQMWRASRTVENRASGRLPAVARRIGFAHAVHVKLD
jgi:hypothetical protein